MTEPASIDDRLETSAVKAENASQIMHDFANGDENTIIDTESGPLPSLARYLAELGGGPNPNIDGGTF